MKKLLNIQSLILLLLFSMVMPRGMAEELWPQNLQSRLDSVIGEATILRTSQMGLMVYDLTADSVLYAHDEYQTMRPASTMKLVTAITALDKLGLDYEYITRLAYTGEVNDSTHTLCGNVYLVGGMDPKINRDDLRAFASALKEMGVDTIRGNVYADKTMKDSDLYGEGWCWDDDNPMLSALVYSREDNMLEQFCNVLREQGICHDGTKGDKVCPKAAKVISSCMRPLNDVLVPMMKNSNNLYAESMYYQIGLSQGKPSTAKKARSVEEMVLKKCDRKESIHRFADGSGLSLYNYLSADIEVAFLRYAYAEKERIFDPLYASLPIAAVDGTLKERMEGTSAANNVHAKTGTLSGVSSLAGYCTAENGHLLAFAIINQGVMKAVYAKRLQDMICVAMTRPNEKNKEIKE